MDDAPRAIVRMRRELTATILVADQRPSSRNAYRTSFFGRETAFLRGPERLARRLGMPVVFVEMVRVARGQYRIKTEWLCEDPGATAEGEITERFARRLEQQLRATPDDWFWFHRRWRDRRAERAR
jgi:KDO2-lipid IV(A) lauroyltransferase